MQHSSAFHGTARSTYSIRPSRRGQQAIPGRLPWRTRRLCVVVAFVLHADESVHELPRHFRRTAHHDRLCTAAGFPGLTTARSIAPPKSSMLYRYATPGARVMQVTTNILHPWHRRSWATSSGTTGLATFRSQLRHIPHGQRSGVSSTESSSGILLAVPCGHLAVSSLPTMSLDSSASLSRPPCSKLYPWSWRSPSLHWSTRLPCSNAPHCIAASLSGLWRSCFKHSWLRCTTRVPTALYGHS